jgi:short-subunit dehydrogenase
MQLNNARILLTGASGGLGQELARQLSAAGAQLLLAGRDASRLAAVSSSLAGQGAGQVASVRADLTLPEGIAAAVGAAREFGVNVLINNAGVGCFGLFDQQDWPTVEQVLATNLEAPMRLTQAMLPWLQSRPQAAIVNIGSTFGSLPFPGFAAYSAAKAGLRGFSQALRRELSDTQVAVIHLAPRAIDTPLNSPAVNALNLALKNHSDTTEVVARQVVTALQEGHEERHFGFPEKLFAWINGIAPSLIDRALAGKLSIIKQYAPSR